MFDFRQFSDDFLVYPPCPNQEGVKLTTHHYTVPSLRILEAIAHLSHYDSSVGSSVRNLYGMM
jgi:hypothetical protein